MNRSRDLLDGLAHLTGIRNAQRLEQSLLKTLAGIYASARVWSIQLTAEGRPRRLHTFDRTRDAVVAMAFDHKAPPVPAALLEQALDSGQSVAEAVESGQRVTLFPVCGLKDFSICLAFALDADAEPLDAVLVSSFLSVYRNFVQLIDDAQTDELTGLLNRKTFDENFQELATLERGLDHAYCADDRRTEPDPDATQVWLAVIDVDDFKKINDSFGHVYGDEVLILLARLLRQGFRDSDLIYRFGGEEFVVLAEVAGAEQAVATFERLQQTVASQDLPRVGTVTTSIGVTRVRPYQTASAALDQADQALYYAKANGKNQVCLYDQLLAEGAIQPSAIQTGEIELF
ncbi:GGDEF domain-containing protein [Thioalkalivibrio sp. ALJ16]|uniref:GGDEF domain-containing protein n=1 Tax=Thioalkalivibrio sp. ALJ16 TaxID=1158762 RepID=UPI0003782054|nr:GGDEF domain-containing protein [Thioalkalivibrio sp. ALJ16]